MLAALWSRASIAGGIVGVCVLLIAPEPVGALCARSFGDAQTVPILFEGRAVKRLVVPDGHDDRPQPNYRWIVERPIRGVKAGESVDVVMAVSESHGERFAGSSNDIGPAPQVGDRYLVGAYRGEGAASDRLFTNACNGVLELLEPASTNSGKLLANTQSGPSLRVNSTVAVSAGVALAAVSIMALWRVHRRRLPSRI